jgi:beta-ureidopropionase / N-carbamoyl-L-amino-acid hydrolase
MTSPGQISARRLLDDLATLATFGARPDGGVDRVAGSAADLAARAWLSRRIEDSGLYSWTDEIGNVFGRARAGGGPWLLVGSHSDTVPAGGQLDGAYGVVAALEVLRTLHEAGDPAAETLEIVSFWDEEGAAADSPGGLAGSTALCAGDHIRDVRAYLELHIEQGPRMEAAGLELAVVEGIVGIDRYRLDVEGVPNHAGTTPMDDRSDAGRVVARVMAETHEMVLAIDPTMVANIGSVELLPGAPNVIPGHASLTAEFRARHTESLDAAGAELVSLARAVANEEDCSAQTERISRKPVVRFDPRIRALIERSCRRTGRPVGQLMSYAGHDASALDGRVPTGMMFVPSTDGVSHSPEESSPQRLLVLGCQALLYAVLEVHLSQL